MFITGIKIIATSYAMLIQALVEVACKDHPGTVTKVMTRPKCKYPVPMMPTIMYVRGGQNIFFYPYGNVVVGAGIIIDPVRGHVPGLIVKDSLGGAMACRLEEDDHENDVEHTLH